MQFSMHAISHANDIDPTEAVATPLRKGKPAPFDGTLLSPAAIATIKAEAEAAKKNAELELETQKNTIMAAHEKEKEQILIRHRADIEIAEQRYQGSERRLEHTEKMLQDEIDSRPNVYWWTFGGVIAGVLITVFVVKAIE
jgi:hypothetical protein